MPFEPNYRFERSERGRLKKQNRTRNCAVSRSGKRRPRIKIRERPTTPRRQTVESTELVGRWTSIGAQARQMNARCL